MIKYVFFSICFCLAAYPLFAANENNGEEPLYTISFLYEKPDTFYIAVDEMPEIIDGIASIQQRVRYPETAKNDGVEGTVFLHVYVTERGDVANIEVARGVRFDLDQAAVHAVKPTKFKPGSQRGIPVPVRVSIPIHFRLPDPIKIIEENFKKLPYEIKEPMVKIIRGPEKLEEKIRYPQEAIANKEQGVVHATVTLNEQRRISSITIRDGMGYGADEAVIISLAEYKFYEDPRYEEFPGTQTFPVIVQFILPK